MGRWAGGRWAGWLAGAGWLRGQVGGLVSSGATECSTAGSVCRSMLPVQLHTPMAARCTPFHFCTNSPAFASFLHPASQVREYLDPSEIQIVTKVWCTHS